MINSDSFDILFLIGRPAAGKSEIIDFLKRVPEEERKSRFHIGKFIEIDDFPMIWSWFEEDDILTRLGYPRLHTDDEGNFKEPYLWDVLIERLDLEYRKQSKENEVLTGGGTALLEFARGMEHGGFRQAFAHLSPELLKMSAVLYIDVSFEESLRKNRKRFNPDKPHSILEHALPDYKLKRLYGESDWEELSAPDKKYLNLRGILVPYAVFENEDDVTSGPDGPLGKRLEGCTGRLWNREIKR